MKFSVIIPCYNLDRYLRECIDSVINQTMPAEEYEIILINNGSKDSTNEIIFEYSNKHQNIIAINYIENRGVGGGLDIGRKIAQGKYISFVDADDCIDKNLLQTCYEKMEEDDLEILFYGQRRMDAELVNEIEVRVNNKVSEEEVLSGKDFLNRAGEMIQYAPWAKVYNRSFLESKMILFDKKAISMDIILTLDCLIKSSKIGNIYKILYNYRSREESASNAVWKNKKELVEAEEYVLNKLFGLVEKCMEEDIISQSILNGVRQYINRLFFRISMLQLENDSEASKRVNEYFMKYLQKRIELFGEKFDNNEKLNIYSIINKISLNCNISVEKYLKDLCEENRKNCYEILSDIKSLKISLLNKIPFNKKKCIIGIYGSGDHTKNMLQFYEENIGRINSEIIYIDTFKSSNSNVININDINKMYFDCIVISSKSYESEMFENIKKYYSNPNVEVYTFYREFKDSQFNRVILF